MRTVSEAIAEAAAKPLPIAAPFSCWQSSYPGPDGEPIVTEWRHNLATTAASGYTNIYDWLAKAMGMGPSFAFATAASAASSAITITATSLANSGAAFPTSGQGLQGQTVVAYGLANKSSQATPRRRSRSISGTARQAPLARQEPRLRRRAGRPLPESHTSFCQVRIRRRGCASRRPCLRLQIRTYHSIRKARSCRRTVFHERLERGRTPQQPPRTLRLIPGQRQAHRRSTTKASRARPRFWQPRTSAASFRSRVQSLLRRRSFLAIR